ncbi:LysM peptidoglycan-binding domain-containing protein [Vreelandella jeotgali]|uniref:LysM peptidoglycan-binding domain-containing protein n=1 Tax=Vreelandella jeotgali TaxID=553386 RepID=UPI00034A0F6F|nr:LysM peptidoglycan-binding domain-containing protein [Halomonas jeotgali]
MIALALLALLAGCSAREIQSTRTDAGANQLSGYWVSIQRGDTLGSLAQRAEVPLVRLKRFNPGVQARHLAVGQRILVPTQRERAPSGGPYRYQIRPGDTYTGIARHFNTRAGRLEAANPGTPASDLGIGRLIQIPVGTSGTASGQSARSGGGSASTSAGSQGQQSGGNRSSRASNATPDLPDSAGSWPWPLDDYRVVRAYGKDDRGRLQPTLLEAKSDPNARAVASGKVSFANTMRQLGEVVIIQHPGNLQSVYALCDEVSVTTEQKVDRGDSLCRVSENDSGRSILLFDMRRNGKPMNPARLME